jgi:hypothetical protein
MARLEFKHRSTSLDRRVRVSRLRNVLPRHHMGRVNRAPGVRPIEMTQGT